MRFLSLAATAALVLSATATRAEMSDDEKLRLACMGWAGDRVLISVIGKKHRELAGALDDIATTNPTKPLARTVSESLTTIDAHAIRAQETSSDAFSAICSP